MPDMTTASNTVDGSHTTSISLLSSIVAYIPYVVLSLPAVIGLGAMIASNVQTQDTNEDDQDESSSYDAVDACLTVAALGMFMLYIPIFIHYVSTRITGTNKATVSVVIKGIGATISVFGIILFVLAMVGSTTTPASFVFARDALASGGLLVGYFTVAVLLIGVLVFVLNRSLLRRPTQSAQQKQQDKHRPTETAQTTRTNSPIGTFSRPSQTNEINVAAMV